MLWLWHRPVATAPIGPLAWEPPYAARSGPRNGKKTKKKEMKIGELSLCDFERREDSDKVGVLLFWFFYFLPFVFLGPRPRHMEVPRLGVESKL